MNFHGRQIDPLSFWGQYVEFPPGTKEEDTFAPKVQCPNPEHDTLKKHFQVNLTQPTVHCFAHCGISGSWEHAVCVIEGLYAKFKVEEAENERERKRRVSRAHKQAHKLIVKGSRPGRISKPARYRKNTPKSTEALRPDELAYERYLPQVALNYLEKRHISEATVAKWALGWLSDEKRIVIPARDLNGKLRFLIKRGVLAKQQPKYLYSEGFPKTSLLFGACYIDLGLVHSEGLIVVEGSLDAIRFHQHGFVNTVAILGTGISDQQVQIIEKLRPKKIVLAFDKDASGIRNIEIAAVKLRKYPLYVMRYPQGKSDPAELTRREATRQIKRVIPLTLFNRKTRTLHRGKEIHGTQV